MRNRIYALLSLTVVLLAVTAHYLLDPWGYYWKVSDEEAALRENYLACAQQWLGRNEADGSHQQILDVYNNHEPLAQSYVVQSTDSWCATFVSAAAISAGLPDIIPTECSCQRQIALFRELGCWQEDDHTMPQPGDLIYYNWDQKYPGENTGWADHVGIVVGIKWPFIKVIEGNYDDQVAYRVIHLWDVRIRGFATPNYAG